MMRDDYMIACFTDTGTGGQEYKNQHATSLIKTDSTRYSF